MLAELKDLGEKGLFSPTEIKQIIKKRTAFEMALVRRIPNKNDYLRYAAYEMGLEALRRKRATRMSVSPYLFPCPSSFSNSFFLIA
jgi:U3 small nucleolar RNA-associated protein 6